MHSVPVDQVRTCMIYLRGYALKNVDETWRPQDS